MIIKNILLTGASSGIGEALAVYYAQLPTTENIFICGRNKERLNAVKQACLSKGKANIHAKVLDVTNKEEVEAWIKQAEETSPLNLVFANAGVAEKAIPKCNVCYLDGTEMKTAMEVFLSALKDINPNSIGGKLPAADFYYNAQ